MLTCLRLLQQVECFGKKINHPQVLEVLFRTLPRSPLDVRHAAMKEMNVLFVRKEENYKIFMKQRAWQTWLVPLVASIPADKEVRVLRVASVCKSRAHVFACVLTLAGSHQGRGGVHEVCAQHVRHGVHVRVLQGHGH